MQQEYAILDIDSLLLWLNLVVEEPGALAGLLW